MKKYTHILLTTMITLPTTCMEKERKKSAPLNIQSSSIVRPANSKLYSVSTINGLLEPQQPLLPTPKIIYKQFSDVGFNYVPVYVPVNTNEASKTDDIPLTPLYKPISPTEYLDCRTNTQKTVPQCEMEKYFTEQLYNSACKIIDFHFRTDNHNMSQKDIVFTQNNNCITLIEFMIAAKKKGITEDFVGNLSYTKWNDPTACFIFSCFKKYILTIHDLGEKLPFNGNDFYTNNNLNQTLKTTNKTCITAEQIATLIENCPTYCILLTAMENLKVSNNIMIPYLYSSTRILSEKHPTYSHITDIHECFDILDLHLNSPESMAVSTYNSLNLVEQIKKITKITKEKDLGYILLTLKKKTIFKEKFLWWRPTTYSQHHQNIIALFCILVEKYHKDRGDKITPKPMQVCIYEFHNIKKHIALPDSFDTNLLNTKYYALEELYQLTINRSNLCETNEKDIQNLVDQHYILNEQ